MPKAFIYPVKKIEGGGIKEKKIQPVVLKGFERSTVFCFEALRSGVVKFHTV